MVSGIYSVTSIKSSKQNGFIWKKAFFQNTTVLHSSRIRASCPFTNELSFFWPYRHLLYIKLCAFDLMLKNPNSFRNVPWKCYRVIYALFMQKKKTIPLKLQLRRIYICKKTYNSWNILDNGSNSRNSEDSWYYRHSGSL